MAREKELRPATAEAVEQLSDVSGVQDAFQRAGLLTNLLAAAREGVDDLVVEAFDQVVGANHLVVGDSDFETAVMEAYDQALDPERLLDGEAESPEREFLNEFWDEDAAMAAARTAALKVTGGTGSTIREIDLVTGRTTVGDSRYDQPAEDFHTTVAEAAQRLQEGIAALFEQYLKSVSQAREQMATALEAADLSVPDPVPDALEAARQLGAAHRTEALAAMEDSIETLTPGEVSAPPPLSDDGDEPPTDEFFPPPEEGSRAAFSTSIAAAMHPEPVGSPRQPQLENWAVIRYPFRDEVTEDDFVLPDVSLNAAVCLCGSVFWKKDRVNGSFLCTSRLDAARGLKVVTFSGSIYVLGEPDAAYVSWCERQRRPLNRERPFGS